MVHGSPVNPPVALGTVYLELALAGLEARSRRLSFKGDPAVGWRADALLLRADGTADVQAVTLDDTGRAPRCCPSSKPTPRSRSW